MTLRLTFFIAVPATVGLIVLNREIIFTLFQYGRFSAEDGARTAYTLMFLGLGLVFFSAVKIVIPAFYAFKDTRTPVVGSCLALAANLFFILILIKPLRIGGIALANSLAALTNLIFLSWQLNRKYFKIPYREVLPSLYKTCAASLVMGAGCFATSRLMGFRADGSLWGRIFPLAVTILAGIAIYLLMSVLLKSREIREAKEVFARKLITVPGTKGTG